MTPSQAACFNTLLKHLADLLEDYPYRIGLGSDTREILLIQGPWTFKLFRAVPYHGNIRLVVAPGLGLGQIQIPITAVSTLIQSPWFAELHRRFQSLTTLDLYIDHPVVQGSELPDEYIFTFPDSAQGDNTPCP